MKEYILNSSPVRTSENYGINDIKLNLDIPQYKYFDNFSIYTEELNKIEVDIIESDVGQLKKLRSNIGLEFENYSKIVIRIPENSTIEKPIVLDYLFDEDNNNLIDNIEIYLEKNSKASFILHYCNELENENFHHLKQVTVLGENAIADITIANLINNNSKSFIAVENELKDGAFLTHRLIEIGGEYKISNYYSKMLGDNSTNELKSIYLGTDNDIIDINYNIEVLGKNAKCNIESQGALTGCSSKSFKGTIDFK